MSPTMSVAIKQALLLASFALLVCAGQSSENLSTQDTALENIIPQAIAQFDQSQVKQTQLQMEESRSSASDASLSQADRIVRRPICYIKRQRCCFKFRLCGPVYKKVKAVHRCDFKRCRRVCPVVCKFRFRTIKKKVCNTVRKPVIKCVKIQKKHYGKLVWISKCKNTFANKTLCIRKPVVVKRKVCRRRCSRRCVVVRAICVKVKVLTLHRYCPYAVCGGLKVVGVVKAPRGYVVKKPFEVKVLKRRRIVLKGGKH